MHTPYDWLCASLDAVTLLVIPHWPAAPLVSSQPQQMTAAAHCVIRAAVLAALVELRRCCCTSCAATVGMDQPAAQRCHLMYSSAHGWMHRSYDDVVTHSDSAKHVTTASNHMQLNST